MNVFMLCLSLLVTKKMPPPRKFQEIFPALSRQKIPSEMLIRVLSPPWKFLKVDRYESLQQQNISCQQIQNQLSRSSKTVLSNVS